MQTKEQIHNVVKQKYGEIAREKKQGCGCGCGSKQEITMAESYSGQQGYVAEADLGLGCGIPTQHAAIQPGETVLDLGSGAGNDVFVARSLVGESGYVIGVDMTTEMVEQANRNKQKLGFDNVDFRLGEIEALPVDDNSIDLVISNCVLNLVPDKHAAFSEITRVLKEGGRFVVSDIVVKGDMPDSLRNSAAAYAGCVAGALQEEAYLQSARTSGLKDIEIKSRRVIDLPPAFLQEHLDKDELAEWGKGQSGIYSITVSGKK